MKKRTKAEVDGIIKDSATGMSVFELCTKHEVSEDQLYRILKKFKGAYSDIARREKSQTKVKKLEKKVREQQQEIDLLRAALKKY